MIRIEGSKTTTAAFSFALLAALVVAMATICSDAFSVQRFGATRTTIANHQQQQHQNQQQQQQYHTLLARPISKWDLLEDDDTDDDDSADDSGSIENSSSSSTSIPIAPDMTYVERNVKRAHETFLGLRTIGNKEVCHDVYAKSPKPSVDEVWYVGKVAKVSDVALEDCIARQWNLIETHATNLRPIELYPHRGNLELWTAPGDTELEVAYNRPELVLQKMTPFAVTAKELNSNRIGFQGEVYQEGEEGFRSWRNPDGSPARPEINAGGETRPPTEAEMKQLLTDTER